MSRRKKVEEFESVEESIKDFTSHRRDADGVGREVVKEKNGSPEEPPKTMTIRLPVKLWEALQIERIKRRRRSVNEMVIEAIELYLSEIKK